MNRIVVTILCVLFFFNGVIAQLIKLPQLFAHFHEHKLADPQLELSDFVTMHYISGDNNDSDNDRDSQLPFKKFDDSAGFNVEMIFTKQKIFIVSGKSPLLRKCSFYYSSGILLSFTDDAFRPPATCALSGRNY